MLFYLAMQDSKEISTQQTIERLKTFIKEEIRSAKNSILYTIRKGQNDLMSKIGIALITGPTESEIQKKLGFTKPFEKYEDFYTFDINF